MLNSVQTIAVTGGKGGVGKTNFSVNLAIELAKLGRKVILLDADLGLANVDILLGLRAQYTLEDLLEGQCTINDLLLEGPHGLKVIPASSGTQELVQLNALQHSAIIHEFSQLQEDIEFLIIDTAAGISDTVMSFVRAAQEVLLVVCNEPTSITDAYAMLKLMNSRYRLDRFHVVANMVKTAQEGVEVYQKLLKVTDRFMDVALSFDGMVPFDANLRKAVRRQKALCEAYPTSAAALAVRKIALNIDRWPLPMNPRGHTEFFVDKLVNMAASG